MNRGLKKEIEYSMVAKRPGYVVSPMTPDRCQPTGVGKLWRFGDGRQMACFPCYCVSSMHLYVRASFMHVVLQIIPCAAWKGAIGLARSSDIDELGHGRPLTGPTTVMDCAKETTAEPECGHPHSSRKFTVSATLLP